MKIEFENKEIENIYNSLSKDELNEMSSDISSMNLESLKNKLPKFNIEASQRVCSKYFDVLMSYDPSTDILTFTKLNELTKEEYDDMVIKRMIEEHNEHFNNTKQSDDSEKQSGSTDAS